MLGVLFSGQGSQVEGMGLNLYEQYDSVKRLYDEEEEYIKNMSFYGTSEEIKQTIYTQPLLVTFHLAVLRLLRENNISFQGTAGLSLGEFSTLVAAEVISEKEALEIIKKRAKYMSRCCQENPSKLITLIGRDEQKIETFIQQIQEKNIFIEISNRNCPGQVVVGVLENQFSQFKEELNRADSIMNIELEVEGAFHTSLMTEAERALKQDLEKIDYKENSVPIYLNVTGQKWTDENLVDVMSKQLSHTTYFGKALQSMIDDGVDTFIEVGSNNIIKGLLKRVDRRAKVYPIYDQKTLNNFLSAYPTL